MGESAALKRQHGNSGRYPITTNKSPVVLRYWAHAPGKSTGQNGRHLTTCFSGFACSPLIQPPSHITYTVQHIEICGQLAIGPAMSSRKPTVDQTLRSPGRPELYGLSSFSNNGTRDDGIFWLSSSMANKAACWLRLLRRISSLSLSIWLTWQLWNRHQRCKTNRYVVNDKRRDKCWWM